MKNIASMTDEELISLIQHRVTERLPEDLEFDYKAAVSLNSQNEKKEFVKDITGFANEIGGTVIIGLPETRDSTGAGIPDPNFGIERIPDFETRAHQILHSGASPSLPSVHVRELKLEEGKYLYILHHPKSWAEPHIVKLDHNKYYRRSGHRTIPMAEHEIEKAYMRRNRKVIEVNNHLKKLKPATALLQDATRKLKISIVPMPIQLNRIDWMSQEGTVFLKQNNFMAGSYGYTWTPFGESLIAYDGSRKEAATFYAALHPCGSLVYENSYLSKETFVSTAHVVNFSYTPQIRKFIQTLISTFSLGGRMHIRIECSPLNAYTLTGGAGMEGRGELFMDDHLEISLEVDALELIEQPGAVASKLEAKIARLLGITR